ncbi:hypothetical protein P43SY_000725 [Pythium insidiosum]|uniref:DAGKc domain-containing protein n=1 Tax=Pythium insidiosum TaxID=114742 RepID=A0AAD5LT07_PYTIN|nr:hypothetical protein P43SY_000725 [Pythium insidiosum]
MTVSAAATEAPREPTTAVATAESSASELGTPPSGLMFSFSGSMTPPSQRELPADMRIDPTQIVLLQAQSTASTPRTPHDSPDVAGSRGAFVSVATPRTGDDVHAQPHSQQLNALLSPSYTAPHGFHRPYSLPDDPRLAASSDDSAHPLPGKLKKRSVTYVSQRAVPRESVRALARQAVSQRKVSIGDVTFEAPRESNLRESIRRVQAYSRREAPIDTALAATVLIKKRECEITMDADAIEWKRRNRARGQILTDDVVGAELAGETRGGGCVVRVHYFVRGKGQREKALRRRPMSLDVTCASRAIADQWVLAIQELVRWQARAPPLAEKRRIKVVVNPHSGKRRAREIWAQQVKPFFDLGNFDYVVEETTYGGHAIDMGKKYSSDDGFESLVFVGGDGTLCEFMNGLLSRPEHEWREIVATTPISLISAGTQNAFGVGVGIPTVAAAVYCIIKRKMRPLDVITAVAEQDPSRVQYSYCGLGWGVAGDIAAESERYRWLGTSRYTFLKFKRGFLMPKRHTGRVRWVGVEPEPPLRKYYDIRDEGAQDQFEMEEGNVYDSERWTSTTRKSWNGYCGAVRSPASRKRYPESMWKEDRGRYVVVGTLNAAPDAAFAHPSDGHLDLIISRKGNLFRMIQLGILYLFGKELKSPLISYHKVKAVIIEQDQPENCMNIDGEVLPGPGPWRIEVVPSLFKALSEK